MVSGTAQYSTTEHVKGLAQRVERLAQRIEELEEKLVRIQVGGRRTGEARPYIGPTV